MSTWADILVIGDGPVGLCAALALRQKGFGVVLSRGGGSGVERVPRGQVFALGARALDFLGGLGVEVKATPIERVCAAASSRLGGLDISERTGGVVGARALYEALLGAVGREGVCGRVVTLRGAQARCEGGEEITAGVVVAADGAESLCRRAAGIEAVRWQTGQTALNILATLSAPHNNTARQYFLPTGPLAVLPLAGRDVGLVWTVPSESLQESISKPKLKALLNEHLDVRIETVAWVEGVVLRCVLARRFVSGRVVLVGDAAHRFHPLAGQGLTVAFKDVAVLADCLERGRKLGLGMGQVDLGGYERARRAEAVGLSFGFSLLDKVFQNGVLRPFASLGLGMAGEDFLARCAKQGGPREWPQEIECG